MATISGIRYDLTIQGNSYISDLSYNSQFIPTSKIELLYDNLTSSNGEILIPLTGTDLIKTIIAKSDNMTVKLYNISGMVNKYDVSGIMLNELAPVISSGIASGSVSTVNTTGISAAITLIGYITV